MAERGVFQKINSLTEVKRNKGIDLVKVLMAFVVVSIHTTAWPLLGIREVAVPYFFIVSGFFLFGKMTGDRAQDLAVIRAWTLKILKLYLIWTAVYLPFTVYGYVHDGLSLKQSLAVFVRNLAFVGENFMSWPLWYLLSLIWGGVLFYLLRTLKVPVWGMLLVGILLFALPRIPGVVESGIYRKLFRDGTNLVWTGPMYLAIGGLLQHYNSRIPLWGGIFLFITGLMVFQYTWVALPFAAAGLFLLAREIPLPWISDRLSRAFRDGSETIYLVHMIFAALLILLAGLDKGALLFTLTSLLAAATAFGRYKWKTR